MVLWLGRYEMSFFKKFVRNNDGATAIEYGLIAALIAVSVIAAISSLGNKVQQMKQAPAAEISK